jgi:DNA mismatch repair protein PMS2
MKIQKAFNEVYRSFNANQAPFILADFIIPTSTFCFLCIALVLTKNTIDTCDVNVSPDKRTIFLHGEAALIIKLKVCSLPFFSSSTNLGPAFVGCARRGIRSIQVDIRR